MELDWARDTMAQLVAISTVGLMALLEKVYSSKRKLLGSFGVLGSLSFSKFSAVSSSLQPESMVSEFTSMIWMATIEDQGGFHMIETFWECLLVVVIIMSSLATLHLILSNSNSFIEVIWKKWLQAVSMS